MYGAAAAVVATATIGTIAVASPGLLGATGDAKAPAGDVSLQSQFANAAREFDVPQSVLMAVSYRQTRWESHDGLPSVTGDYNVMGLTKVDPEDLEGDSDEHNEHLVNGTGDPSIEKKIDKKKMLAPVPKQKVDTDDPKLHTLDKAAELIDSSTETVQNDTGASIRAGAALLAEYQKQAGAELSEEPGDWYPAVARFSQSEDRKGADQFAKRVFESIKTGEAEITTDGEQIVLPADPTVEPVKPANVPLAATSTATTATTECPAGLACSYDSAAYVENKGNYNIASRVPYGTGGFDIRQIVIHDVEGTHDGAVSVFKNPEKWASAHYIVRADGRVTQMVETKNEAFHAGNKTVNMHSIGIEHEGYAIKGGSNWYKESQYDTTAEMVKYLAAKYKVPLTREHIIGHDEVPGVVDIFAGGVHWDPGPFWDWSRFMAKVGAPTGAGGAGGLLTVGQTVRVVPPFTSANQPPLTYTEDNSDGTVTRKTAPTQPANFGYLYTQPTTDSATIKDPYISGAVWNSGDNWGNKVVAGGQYVVAGTSGNWTAIWYGSQKAWFYNPGGQYTSLVNTAKTVVKPVGTTAIKVYGRAYPNREAYTGTGVPIQDDSLGRFKNEDPLTKYTIPTGQGQAYVAAGAEVAGDYYSSAYNKDGTRVQGTTKFIPIRYNHRIAWVQSKDVQVVSAAAPIATDNRYNLLARDASGVLWQYQGTGKGAFLNRYRVGPGWDAYNTIAPMTALRADGTGDAVARDKDGVLWYYRGSGNPSAPFATRLRVGAGWNMYDKLLGARDMNADGRPDLIARDKTGVLWLYTNTGASPNPFATRVRVGGGWNIYNELISTGDMTGDGKPDLIARDKTGVLWLYKNTGGSPNPFATRGQVGGGWNAYNVMVGPSDLDLDGKPDLIARDAGGDLWFYKNTNGYPNPYATRVRVGGGWGIYNLIV